MAETPQQNNKKRFALLWRFGRPYLGLFVVAEICILVAYAAALLLPMNLSTLVDRVIYKQEYELLWRVILNYALIFIVASAFNLIYAFVWQRIHNGFVVDVKTAIFKRTLHAPPSILNTLNTGDVMSRIDSDSEQFIHVIQRNLFHFVNSILLCVGIIVVVGSINWWIAGMLVVAAVLPIVFTRLSGKLTNHASQQERQVTGQVTGRVFEVAEGMREVRLAGAQRWASDWLMEPFIKLITLGNRKRRIDFFVNKQTYIINLCATLFIYTYCAHLVLSGDLTIGLFLAALEYISLLHRKFNWMLRIYLDWFNRKASIDRVDASLSLPVETADGVVLTCVESISFRDVCFRYSDNNPLVLQNVSFDIHRGQHVGLVGVSGVGKTTIAGLLLRLYEPTSGQILVNGLPLDSFSPQSLRQQFGCVSQDIDLFAGSIRFNLAMGLACPDDDLWRALDQVDMANVIRALPDGLDAELSGGDLSGGQKQRIMIARQLLREVSALILDESTAALDVVTEQLVLNNIFEAFAQNILLTISHRPASLRHCHRIIVLHEGRVESVGSIDELASSAVFHSLFEGLV